MAVGMSEMEGFAMTSWKWRAMGKRLPPSWKKEGDPITLAQMNNNPGNIRYWPGAVTIYGYASFPTVESGWKALHGQIETNVFGISRNWPRRRTHPMSFYEFFAGQRDKDGNVLPLGYPGYAPAADSNHPRVYAAYVLDHLKKTFPALASATLETPIKSLITE